MKKEKFCETLAYKIQTPKNFSEESIQQIKYRFCPSVLCSLQHKIFTFVIFEISTSLKSSGLLHWVEGLLIPRVPKEHSAFIFQYQEAHDLTLEVIQECGICNHDALKTHKTWIVTLHT